MLFYYKIQRISNAIVWTHYTIWYSLPFPGYYETHESTIFSMHFYYIKSIIWIKLMAKYCIILANADLKLSTLVRAQNFIWLNRKKVHVCSFLIIDGLIIRISTIHQKLRFRKISKDITKSSQILKNIYGGSEMFLETLPFRRFRGISKDSNEI